LMMVHCCHKISEHHIHFSNPFSDSNIQSKNLSLFDTSHTYFTLP
jgi:hypothetical protein